jgi:hypothetical protein
MFAAADQLKFENAAKLRDEIRELGRELAGRRGGAAKGQSRTPLPAASQRRSADAEHGEGSGRRGVPTVSPSQHDRRPRSASSDRGPRTVSNRHKRDLGI